MTAVVSLQAHDAGHPSPAEASPARTPVEGPARLRFYDRINHRSLEALARTHQRVLALNNSRAQVAPQLAGGSDPGPNTHGA